MITGDNPLTACHVAKELKISSKKLLILTPPPPHPPHPPPDEGEGMDNGSWRWENISGTLSLPLHLSPSDLRETYDLCLTGDVSKYMWSWVLPVVSCWCRVWLTC